MNDPKEDFLQDQLKLLQRLQEQDAQVQETVLTLRSLPRQLEDAKRALSEMEKRLVRDREAFAENQTFQRMQEAEQKGLAQQIAKSKSKLSQVRNMKESNAMQRELESSRRLLDSREEGLKRLSQTLTEQQVRIEENEAKLQGYRQDLQAQETAAHSRLQELREKSEQAQTARKEVIEKISPAVLKRYETLHQRQRWPILASAERGVCGGCHISISPQIYNNLYRGDSIEVCANCHRILYLPSKVEASDG